MTPGCADRERGPAPPTAARLLRSTLLGVLGAVLLSGPASAFTWPWEVGGPWPTSSEHAVVPLDHPTLEEVLEAAPPWRLFRFAVFGDQRALADGEWQDLMHAIADYHDEEPLLFMVDTGDIVDNGTHADQFRMLRGILEPARDIPYLVGLGNHEVDNNEDPTGRLHSAAFLSYLDPLIRVDRFYYEKKVGPVRFLFLDSNDFAYGDSGETDGVPPPGPPPGSRAEAQMRWLATRLGEIEPAEPLVVVIHHPLVQSSEKHRETAVGLWSYRFRDRTLPEWFAEHGVDLVLVGHTHTYERFTVERGDGRGFDLVNVSGRPRTTFLWWGDDARRPHDIQGREVAWLREKGWNDLEGWQIEQVDVMLEDERNQFAVFRVDDTGSMSMEVVFLDGDGEVERHPAVYLEE